MGCIACGKELAVNAKFCKHCGTNQAHAAASVISTTAKAASANACVKCGADLAETAKFCRTCGTPRTSTATPAPAPASTAPHAPTIVIPPKPEKPLATATTPKEPTPTTQASVTPPPDAPNTPREAELSSVVKPSSVPKAEGSKDASSESKPIETKQAVEPSLKPQTDARSTQTVIEPKKSPIALVLTAVVIVVALAGAGVWIWNSKQQTDTQIAELQRRADEEQKARKAAEESLRITREKAIEKDTKEHLEVREREEQIRKGENSADINSSPQTSSSAQPMLPPCVGKALEVWTNCIGEQTDPDGGKYVGEWKDGTRSGHGALYLSDGRIFNGNLKEGKVSGKGTLMWPDGSKYVGEFANGKFHGKGDFLRADGSIGYSGQWQDGNPATQKP